MEQINALRRDIREIRTLAREAHEAAGTMLFGGSDDGWTEIAKQYEEQAKRLEAALRREYKRISR